MTSTYSLVPSASPMQQFQVPQFITVEDRIIGPLTLKQFLYLLGASSVGLVGWFWLNIFLFIFFALPIAGLFGAMAFAKINGQPLPTVITNAVNYFLQPRLYLWKSAPPPKPGQAASPPPPAAAPPPRTTLTESKLADLAWSLDIKERISRE